MTRSKNAAQRLYYLSADSDGGSETRDVSNEIRTYGCKKRYQQQRYNLILYKQTLYIPLPSERSHASTDVVVYSTNSLPVTDRRALSQLTKPTSAFCQFSPHTIMFLKEIYIHVRCAEGRKMGGLRGICEVVIFDEYIYISWRCGFF